jgi:hypothetical protein
MILAEDAGGIALVHERYADPNGNPRASPILRSLNRMVPVAWKMATPANR